MAVVGATLGLLLGLGLSRAPGGPVPHVRARHRRRGADPDPVHRSSLAYVVGIVVTMVAAFVPGPPGCEGRAGRGDARRPRRPGAGHGSPAGCSARSRCCVGAALAVARPDRRARHRRDLDRRRRGDLGHHRRRRSRPVLGHPVLVACRAVFGRLFGTPGRLAGENALRNPRRTGATASALMIGLAVVSAVGVLAASLSATNDALVDDQFRSDFLVQMPTFQGFPTGFGDQHGGRGRRRPGLAPAGHAGERRGRRQAGPDLRDRRRPGVLRDLRPRR